MMQYFDVQAMLVEIRKSVRPSDLLEQWIDAKLVRLISLEVAESKSGYPNSNRGLRLFLTRLSEEAEDGRNSANQPLAATHATYFNRELMSDEEICAAFRIKL